MAGLLIGSGILAKQLLMEVYGILWFAPVVFRAPLITWSGRFDLINGLVMYVGLASLFAIPAMVV